MCVMPCVCTSYYIPVQFLRRPTYFQSPPRPPLPGKQRWKSSWFTAIKQNAQKFVFHFRLSLFFSLPHGCVRLCVCRVVSEAEWVWMIAFTSLCFFDSDAHTNGVVSANGFPMWVCDREHHHTSIWTETSDLHHIVHTHARYHFRYAAPIEISAKKTATTTRNCCRMDAVDGAYAHLRYYSCPHSRL